MNEIRLTEEFEVKRQKQKKLDKKIKEMSEEEKDLLYQKIIKEEEEVIRKQKRDIKLYSYLAKE